ncbi:hypothetical protein KI387_034385, partial [Taxus chinensis]
DEGSFLKSIMSCVLRVMKTVPLEVGKHPVGLDEHVEQFEKIVLETSHSEQNVQIVGIVGMGGCGKTTLAKELYNRKCSSIDRSSFLFDVRDVSSKNSLHILQKKMLKDLRLKNLRFDNYKEGKVIVANRLRSLRVLIVIDDVDHVEQLDALLPAKELLGWGSLVIVTSRELGVLTCWGISSSYKMEGLRKWHARELLCWHAFLQPYPRQGYEVLVEELLNDCHGLPLSLQVFGGQLYGKSTKYWRSQLHKMSRILPQDIKNRLKLSYDALDEEEQEMFLDVACFFIGEEKNLAIQVWDASGWSGLHSWEVLVNKCLVELDQKNHIRMHDHLRDLGRQIAITQSPSRLWFAGQNINMQPRTMIRGIIAATTGLEDYMLYKGLPSFTSAFQPPLKQCMELMEDSTWHQCWRHFFVKLPVRPISLGLKILVITNNYFTREYAKLSMDLVWLRWFHINNRCLPSWLSLKNLRVLELYDATKLEELWEETSTNPPLQLRELKIVFGVRFERFPTSIGRLKKLTKIVLIGDYFGGPIYSLKTLPDEFCFLQSLEHLELRACFQLSALPNRLGELSNMRHIALSHCYTLTQLPPSFKDLTQLQYLELWACRRLRIANIDILQNMTKLQKLKFTGWRKMEELPGSMTKQASLRELYLDDTMIRNLPIDIGELGKLEVLEIGSPLLTRLPASLGNLSSLTSLIIMGRENSLYPEKSGCPIRELPFGLEWPSSLCRLKFMQLNFTHLNAIAISEDSCPSLETLIISRNGHLTDIQILPGTVKKLEISICNRLKNIKCIRSLVNLQKLKISGCPEIEELPSFANLSSIRKLIVEDSGQAENIQGLEHLSTLETLRAHSCWNVPGLKCFENLTRLSRLEVVAETISALQPCIQIIQ